MWGYPITPVIFIVSSFAIVANEVAVDPGRRASGLFLVLVGLPVYYLWGRKETGKLKR